MAVKISCPKDKNMGGVVVATALSMFAFGAEAPAAAHATMPPRELAAAVKTYRIPAGSIAVALNRLAEVNGVQMVYRAQLTRDLKTRGLSGSYAIEDALGKLLTGTGLGYRLSPDGKSVSIVLAQNDTGTQTDAGGVALPTVEVTATGDGGEGGGADEGGPGGPHDPAAYAVPNAVTATKTNTPIMQTPVSVQVVPQQVLQDQQVVVIEQALQNVSSVYTIGNGGGQSGFSIRGFTTYEYYLDGVRVNTVLGTGARDLADIQQIEVLKGPASILYGRIEPGGLVNLVRKQPESTPSYDVQQQVGSYGFYRTTTDATGPVTPDGNLLYRFDGAYENAGSFIDYVHNDRIFVAPRLHWAPTEDTQANFYLEYFHAHDPNLQGIPTLYNFVAPVPISNNYNEVAHFPTDDLRVGFNWTHNFNPNWSLTQRFDADFRHQTLANAVDNFDPDPLNCTLISCPLQRFILANPYVYNQDYYTSLELTGHFDTFGLSHTLLLGADFYLNNSGFESVNNFTTVPTIDLFHPVHSGDLSYFLLKPDTLGFTKFGQDWYGTYLQDQITLPYNFHLLAGFRYDNAGQSQTGINTIPAYSVSYFQSRENAVKPRFGLLWQPIPQLSLYGDYVENFGLTNGVGANNTPLPPSEARQWEAGVKTDLLNNRLTATVAWFDIIKTNVATPSPDPLQAAQGFLVATGAVRNTGVEFDIQGQLTPEWKTIGSFAYINSKIVKDTGVAFDAAGNPITTQGNTGNRFFGVPALGGSLWAVYEPQAEPFKGLSLGVGDSRIDVGLIQRGKQLSEVCHGRPYPASP
jgi:iron complex outermembrane receptor protein